MWIKSGKSLVICEWVFYEICSCNDIHDKVCVEHSGKDEGLIINVIDFVLGGEAGALDIVRMITDHVELYVNVFYLQI